MGGAGSCSHLHLGSASLIRNLNQSMVEAVVSVWRKFEDLGLALLNLRCFIYLGMGTLQHIPWLQSTVVQDQRPKTAAKLSHLRILRAKVVRTLSLHGKLNQRIYKTKGPFESSFKLGSTSWQKKEALFCQQNVVGMTTNPRG